MKKTWVTVVNVIIMIAMLTFVVLYSNFENKNTTQRQINENASAIGSESILFVGSKLRQVWHSRVQNCTDFERKNSLYIKHKAKILSRKWQDFCFVLFVFKSSVFIIHYSLLYSSNNSSIILVFYVEKIIHPSGIRRVDKFILLSR